eukprot:TRINITY_DN9250_c0_g2_i1.p1 TRINITY_DN9250_c0_g2~~TRINITY_DN9250_c0_g2_i1.p1  ORF type:complete len:545 (-),score=103.45 TRINITY_DN9250_c0_g2_i1:208-1842(-)
MTAIDSNFCECAAAWENRIALVHHTDPNAKSNTSAMFISPHTAFSISPNSVYYLTVAHAFQQYPLSQMPNTLWLQTYRGDVYEAQCVRFASLALQKQHHIAPWTKLIPSASHDFVILARKDADLSTEPPIETLLRSIPFAYPRVSEQLLLLSCPFAQNSAPLFLSHGSIVTVAAIYPHSGVSVGHRQSQSNPDSPALYLTNARHLSGMEGGVALNSNGHLVGVVLPKLRTKSAADENPFAVHVPWSSALQALLKPSEIPQTLSSIPSVSPMMHSAVQSCLPSIVLVECGRLWGTGVIIHKDGYVLTNAHVLKDGLNLNHQKELNPDVNLTKLRVRVDYDTTSAWFKAKPIFCSLSSFDIALLKIEPSQQLQPISIASTTKPRKGQRIAVLGHGLYGSSLESRPRVTTGIVSQVVHTEEAPTLILSSADVHAGNSGGALIDSNGRMIGLVAKNCRQADGKSIPELNFSIAASSFEHVIKFIEQQDETVLSKYSTLPPQFERLWVLKDKLQDEPQMPSSRFTNFLAQMLAQEGQSALESESPTARL